MNKSNKSNKKIIRRLKNTHKKRRSSNTRVNQKRRKTLRKITRRKNSNRKVIQRKKKITKRKTGGNNSRLRACCEKSNSNSNSKLNLDSLVEYLGKSQEESQEESQINPMNIEQVSEILTRSLAPLSAKQQEEVDEEYNELMRIIQLEKLANKN